MYGEKYRSFSSSLCSLLHSPVTLSLLGPNILLSTLFSNALSLPPPPQCERPSCTPIHNNGQNYSSVYLHLWFLESNCTTARQKVLQRMIASIHWLQSYRECPSDWFRLVLSQTLFLYKYPEISSRLFFLVTPPMNMEKTEYSNLRHIKFRRPGPTQQKEYNKYRHFITCNMLGSHGCVIEYSNLMSYYAVRNRSYLYYNLYCHITNIRLWRHGPT
jgi:hypothetical protein